MSLKYKPAHIESVPCNICAFQTAHKRLFVHSQEGSDAEGDERWTAKYEVFECQGCNEVTMRETFWSSEFTQGSDEVTYHPVRMQRRVPPWIYEIDDRDVFELFKEMYLARDSDQPRLALMGCRAIIDRLIQSQIGDVGTFAKALETMEAKQLLSPGQRDVLEAAIDAGNASAHRGYKPVDSVLDKVIDIVEHAVHATQLKGAADTVRKKTPKRGS